MILYSKILLGKLFLFSILNDIVGLQAEIVRTGRSKMAQNDSTEEESGREIFGRGDYSISTHKRPKVSSSRTSFNLPQRALKGMQYLMVELNWSPREVFDDLVDYVDPKSDGGFAMVVETLGIPRILEIFYKEPLDLERKSFVLTPATIKGLNRLAKEYAIKRDVLVGAGLASLAFECESVRDERVYYQKEVLEHFDGWRKQGEELIRNLMCEEGGLDREDPLWRLLGDTFTSASMVVDRANEYLDQDRPFEVENLANEGDWHEG